MVKPLYYYLFLPVTLLAAMCTDTKINFKFVCKGTSVEVFQNVTSTFLKSEYTLYKLFGNQAETMATWVMQNFSTEATILQKYTQKVSLENGSILLQNVQASDEATYRMLYENLSRNKEIQICVLVPPTLSCKPSIKHEENYLIASLDNSEFCGKPLVSVRWMEYHGRSSTSKSRIELPHGNEAGTYRACIEGEALNCVTTSSLQDNCENYTIGSGRENTSPTISDIPQLTKTTYVIVAIVSIVLFGVIAILIKLFWKHFGIGRKNVPRVEREGTTGAPSSRTAYDVDADPVHDNSDRGSTAHAMHIELRPMLGANRSLHQQ